MTLCFDCDRPEADFLCRCGCGETICEPCWLRQKRTEGWDRLLAYRNRPGIAWTLEEIASFVGVTRGRIQQIEAKALRKLKHPSYSRRLRAFAEPSKPPPWYGVKRTRPKKSLEQAEEYVPKFWRRVL